MLIPWQLFGLTKDINLIPLLPVPPEGKRKVNFLNMFLKKEKGLSCLSPTPDGLELPAANVLCNCYLLNLFNDTFLLVRFPSLSKAVCGIQGSDLLGALTKVQSAGAESVDDLINTRTQCL